MSKGVLARLCGCLSDKATHDDPTHKVYRTSYAVPVPKKSSSVDKRQSTMSQLQPGRVQDLKIISPCDKTNPTPWENYSTPPSSK